MATQRGLTVRGSERQQIELPVEFVVAEEHRAQVRFSPNSSAQEQFAVSGVTFDLSAGGLGFRADQFLPRHCEGVIRVLAEAPAAAGGRQFGKPAKQAPARLEHRAKVRRVWMNHTDGSYAIGLAFVNPTPALEGKALDLLREFEKSLAGQIPAASGQRGERGHD